MPKVRKRRARAKTGPRDFRFHRLDAAAVGNTVHEKLMVVRVFDVLLYRNECDGAHCRSHPMRCATNGRTVPAASRAGTHDGTATVVSVSRPYSSPIRVTTCETLTEETVLRLDVDSYFT